MESIVRMDLEPIPKPGRPLSQPLPIRMGRGAKKVLG
jgi:hypothetical protein